MLTKEDLDAIRSRAEASTDGGWSFIPKEDFITADSDGDVVFALDMYRKEDATFIAHARTDVPALLGEVERLNDEVAGLRAHAKNLNTTIREVAEERDIAKSQMSERSAVAEKSKEIAWLRQDNERLLKTVDVLSERTDDAMIATPKANPTRPR